MKTEKLMEKAKPFFEGVHDSHDWFHVMRVHRNAVRIAKAEKADIELVEAAAILHDIARKAQDEGVFECHATGSAVMAKPILKELGYNNDFIKKVQNCIKVHRYSKGIEAKTLEEKILQDADRLDALGAVSIARIFSYGGSHNRPVYDPLVKPGEKYTSNAKTGINHFHEKILNIKPETFKTKTAQEMAKRRYKFTQEYLKEFMEEWDGKK